jgi:hypothetical protein
MENELSKEWNEKERRRKKDWDKRENLLRKDGKWIEKRWKWKGEKREMKWEKGGNELRSLFSHFNFLFSQRICWWFSNGLLLMICIEFVVDEQFSKNFADFQRITMDVSVTTLFMYLKYDFIPVATLFLYHISIFSAILFRWRLYFSTKISKVQILYFMSDSISVVTLFPGYRNKLTTEIKDQNISVWNTEIKSSLK